MTPEQQMAEIQSITERWLRILEKDINRLLEKKGKPQSVVHSACMSAAARLATSTVLANPRHMHEGMFKQFDHVVTNLYTAQMKAQGPQIILPGHSIN